MPPQTPEQLELITPAEVAALLAEAGMVELSKDSAATAYLAGQLTEQVYAASPEIYETLRAALTQPMPPGAMEEVLRRAREEARTLIKNIAATDLKAMGEAIARGLAAGDDPLKIAKTLDMIQGLDNVRAGKLEKLAADLESAGLSPEEIEKRVSAAKEVLLKERREAIARTETANAIEVAQAEQAKAGGKQFKIWVTTGDGKVSDICMENEAAGWIGIEESFPSGDDQPPGHPNCRCACAYREATPTEEDIAAAQARADRTQAAAAGEGEGNKRA